MPFSDKKLYSTSGGEVLFTKMDQEAEMDIKVRRTFNHFNCSNVMKHFFPNTGLSITQFK